MWMGLSMHLQNSSSLCRMQGCKRRGPLYSVLRRFCKLLCADSDHHTQQLPTLFSDSDCWSLDSEDILSILVLLLLKVLRSLDTPFSGPSLPHRSLGGINLHRPLLWRVNH
jgi:hypothetical protein